MIGFTHSVSFRGPALSLLDGAALLFLHAQGERGLSLRQRVMTEEGLLHRRIMLTADGQALQQEGIFWQFYYFPWTRNCGLLEKSNGNFLLLSLLFTRIRFSIFYTCQKGTRLPNKGSVCRDVLRLLVHSQDENLFSGGARDLWTHLWILLRLRHQTSNDSWGLFEAQEEIAFLRKELPLILPGLQRLVQLGTSLNQV